MAKECISDELACGLEEGGAKLERRQPTQGQHSLLGKPTQCLSVELNSLQDTHTAAKKPSHEAHTQPGAKQLCF